ncbi:hypothetical protein ABI069_14665, partial [Enterococcus faecium]|uniref:hypothetical protein n=1 Tax=Enterococcus faecium TaxID=1352 RepID=UPI003F439055
AEVLPGEFPKLDFKFGPAKLDEAGDKAASTTGTSEHKSSDEGTDRASDKPAGEKPDKISGNADVVAERVKLGKLADKNLKEPELTTFKNDM